MTPDILATLYRTYPSYCPFWYNLKKINLVFRPLMSFKAENIIIPIQHASLYGILAIPKHAKGIILFVHGSGSSRLSIRNQQVASYLNSNQLATLLFDLLTEEEDIIDAKTAEFRFNISFLAARLIEVTKWCLDQPIIKSFGIGYFGASTGAAAALIAAATQSTLIKAIVSRGGRPDLAQASLPMVKTPTLLIVGENDEVVIELNQLALKQLYCPHQLKIIKHATHLFEEPGTLKEVAQLANTWFLTYL